MSKDLDDIYETVTDLVRPRMLTQKVTAYVHGPKGGEWRSKQRQIEIPSLIDQLQAVFVSSSGEQTGSGFASRPNARVDAMDTLMRIDTEAGNWVDQLGHIISPDVKDNLRWLNEHAPHMTDGDQLHWLSRDVKGWGTCARVVTGWEVPAFKPDNTCPLCAKKGGLRIRTIEEGAYGACMNCGESWTPETIGLLAQHIIVENDTPGREWVELEPLEVPCLFCQAEPGLPCRTGLLREETEPHGTRRMLAQQGALAVAS